MSEFLHPQLAGIELIICPPTFFPRGGSRNGLLVGFHPQNRMRTPKYLTYDILLLYIQDALKRNVVPNLQETSSLKVKHYSREEGDKPS